MIRFLLLITKIIHLQDILLLIIGSANIIDESFNKVILGSWWVDYQLSTKYICPSINYLMGIDCCEF